MNKDTGLSLDAVFDITTTDTFTDAVVVPSEILPAVIVSPTEQTIAERQANEDFEFSRGAIKSVAVEAQNTSHTGIASGVTESP